MKTSYSFDPRRPNQSRLYRPRPLSHQGWRTRRTCICRRFCKASSSLGPGWHPGLDRLVVNREAPPSAQLREPMGNSGEGQEKKAEAVADLLRSTSKIWRNADAVRLRIRDMGSIPIA